jgi:hypothetical protein
MQDRSGCMPFCVAVAGHDAANLLVVKLLGNANPATCSMLDKCGRIMPLHLACNFSHDKEEEDVPWRVHSPLSYDVVWVLLS